MRVLATTVVCGFLISCGGGGGGSATGGAGGAGGASGSGGSGATGMISLRVVHTFLPSGMTIGPALDIYDEAIGEPSTSATPLIAGLSYGTVSGYVKPHLQQGGVFRLTALPAGSPPTDGTDQKGLWAGVDDGSHPQLTIVLSAEEPGVNTPLSGLAFSTYVEKGDDSYGSMGPLAPTPPAGQGEYLAGPIEVTAGNSVGGDYYLLVDDSCAPPLNGDPNVPDLPLWAAADGVAPVSSFALFAATPGSHDLSVVPWPSATPPTCQQLMGTGQGTITVSIAAGQQIITIAYGSSSTDLHLLTAPVAP
ncbi:MAG TPA: hypothetical protein VGP64_08655 [Polyangia bacterium]|jgi:hypothetical protein